jgi:hypothetical protein
LARARELDRRLTDFPRAAAPAGRCGHAALVEHFLDHLRRRAEAGEIQPATVRKTALLSRASRTAGATGKRPAITGLRILRKGPNVQSVPPRG